MILSAHKEQAFDGKTYDPLFDRKRLDNQLGRVYEFMSRGGWYTLAEISAWTRDPEASVSARLRDLRKEKHGLYDVQGRPRGPREQGLYEYHLGESLLDKNGQRLLF